MSWILRLLLKLTLGRHLVKVLGWLHNIMDGKKSEIIMALIAIVHLLKMTAIVPVETSENIEKALLTLLPVALADRASKVIKNIENTGL